MFAKAPFLHFNRALEAGGPYPIPTSAKGAPGLPTFSLPAPSRAALPRPFLLFLRFPFSSFEILYFCGLFTVFTTHCFSYQQMPAEPPRPSLAAPARPRPAGPGRTPPRAQHAPGPRPTRFRLPAAADFVPCPRSHPVMAPLRFSANVSWLFPELPDFPARLRAAGSSGFEAAEIAWPYAEPPEVLARAAQEAGLQLVLINTPPGAPRGPGRAREVGRVAEPGLRSVLSAGDREKGEMGLGAVPGRQAAFREGLEQAVLYAKALGCPRYPVLSSSPSVTHVVRGTGEEDARR